MFVYIFSRARKWAEMAGRDDLKMKRLENLTKYYLCSDHFSPDCFLNPDVEDKSFLRLNRVFSIPNPSIFEDNLMKNVKLVTENPEKFVNYTRYSLNDPPPKRETRKVAVQKRVEREIREDVKLEQEDVVQESVVSTIEQEEIITEPAEYIDDYIVEEDLEISRTNEDEPININEYCRLCARNIEVLIPIFDDNGDFTEEAECLNVMPTGLIQMNDNLPQSACNDCLDKLQACANVIDGFVVNQTLFVSE